MRLQLNQLEEDNLKPIPKLLLTGLAYLSLGLGVVQAAPIIQSSPGTQYTTDKVDGIRTTGADMGGMAVTVCTGSRCDTQTWAKGDGDELGGASGTGWSLMLNGDSFTGAAFELQTALAVTSFSMNGRPGLTTFDITTNPEASPGSELGLPFTFVSSSSAIGQINVLYTDALRVENVFYGDLYLVMQVDFNGAGFSGLLEFRTDTDNTAVINPFQTNPAPEPATLALTAVALLGLAASRRRSSANQG